MENAGLVRSVNAKRIRLYPRSIRWQPLVALLPLILGSLLLIAIGWTENPGATADVVGYQLAGERLVAGQSIYADPSPDTTSLDYRHAPWLAWLWAGLNLLPAPVLLWQLASLGAAVYIIWSLARLGGQVGLVLAATALPLLGSVPHANVGILMIALLVWRRADPISVGIAASLKIYPILLVLGYIAERRWRDVGIAVGVAALLWLPALWSGIADAPPIPGTRGIVPPELLPFAVVLAVVPALWLAWRRSRWTWLAIGAALPLAVPHHVGVEYVWVAALGPDPVHPEDRRHAGIVGRTT